MFSQNGHAMWRLARLQIVAGVAVLALLSLGFSVWSHSWTVQRRWDNLYFLQTAAVSLVQPAMAPTSLPRLIQNEQNAASVIVEQGLIKFYFSPGQAELAEGASDALLGIVRAAGSTGRLVISGFHDASGNGMRNVALARQRAQSVRRALKALGVRDAQIEIQQPKSLPLASNGAEARRVEISLQ